MAATKYKSGQVSAALFENACVKASNNLATLFAPAPAVEKKKPKVDKVSKRLDESQKNHVKNSTPAWSAPFVHETLLKEKPKKQKSPAKPVQKRILEKQKNEDDDEAQVKRPRRNRLRDKTNDNRTLFIGNCPLSADKKVLKSLFKEYGDIESIRFRCAPPADPNLPRRAIVIQKNFHEQCKNYVAYVVFKEEAAAKKALARNGHVLDGLHLRVDISTMSKKHDKKRSIFVGNLPFDITEEDLWSHFEDCGDINNVRVVRDRQTSLGKGIGYVQFDSKDAVSLALKLNKTKVQGREIRVQVCTNKPDKFEKKGKKETEEGKTKVHSKPKKPKFAPSNSTTASNFHTKLNTKKEKRLKKIKKKKENAKKEAGLTSSGPAAFKSPKRKFTKHKNPGKKGKADGKKPMKKNGVKTFIKGKGQKGKPRQIKTKGNKKKS